MPREFHEDAAIDTIFLEQELESVSKEVYAKYPESQYSMLIPVDSSDDEGAESVGYIYYDEVGASAIVAEGTTESPSVDAFAKKVTLPVHEIGNHYKWTNREMRNETKAGRSIRVRRASTAARSIEQHHDDIAMLADGTAGLRFGGMYGMVFHPNVSKISALKTFATATNDEILTYFGTCLSRVIGDTKGVFEVDTIATDHELKTYLISRIITGTSDTLWSRIKETMEDAGVTFVVHHKLRDVGKNPTTNAVAPTRAMIFYKRSPEVLNYKMPMSFKQYPAVNIGREARIETGSTTAGVEVIQPLAVLVYHSF